LRARRAARVTRLNLESTRSSNSSIGGVIIVSWLCAMDQLLSWTFPGCDSLAAYHGESALPLALDDRQHLVDRAFEVVVHDQVVGFVAPDPLLDLRLAESGLDLVAGVAPTAQPTFLLLAARWEDENQHRLRVLELHLLGTVELDLEHDVG